jgi:prophage regulatory protein
MGFRECRRRESVNMCDVKNILAVDEGNDLCFHKFPLTEIIRLESVGVVSEMLGISRSGIYERMDPNSKYFDPDFPKPVQLGRSTIRFVVFEINEYIMKKIEDRNLKDGLMKVNENNETCDGEVSQREVVDLI